ncbi:MAG: hypothetical protein OHK0039_31100 [Bacteroidia bacterium]
MNAPDLQQLHTLETMLAFLEDKLPSEETARIEQLIRDDSDYASAMEELEKSRLEDPDTARRAIRQRDIFRSRVQRLGGQGQHKAPGTPTAAMVFQIAAAIAILILPIAYKSLYPSSAQLFAQHHERYEDATRGRNVGITRGSDPDARYQMAMHYYDQQNYTEAADLLASYLAEAGQDTDQARTQTARMHYAVSLLFLDQDPQPAIDALKGVIASQDARYLHDAQWYLGLAYLKADDTDAAKAILGALPPLEDDAARLLQRLD